MNELEARMRMLTLAVLATGAALEDRISYPNQPEHWSRWSELLQEAEERLVDIERRTVLHHPV